MYIKVGVIALGHFNTGTCSIRSGHFRIWQIWIKSQFPERVGTRSLQRARRLQWIRADWQLLCLATFAILIFILVILQTFHTFHQVPPGNRTLALTQHHPDLPRGADCWPSRAENDYCACCGRTGLLVCFNDLYAFVECVCVIVCVCAQWMKANRLFGGKKRAEGLPIQAKSITLYKSIYRNTVACPEVSGCVRKCDSQTDVPSFTV